jgi:hypothetical protein
MHAILHVFEHPRLEFAVKGRTKSHAPRDETNGKGIHIGTRQASLSSFHNFNEDDLVRRTLATVHLRGNTPQSFILYIPYYMHPISHT